MKLSLVVLSPTRMLGKVIPVSRLPFLIGRDPECYLRPSSTTVSNRHCAIHLRSGRVSIEDFDSTNGTLVNDRRIKGEIELLNGDRLTIGPLVLELRLQMGTPVSEATPLPPTKASTETAADDAAAAVLLSMDDGGDTSSPHRPRTYVPAGDTEIISLPQAEMSPPPDRSHDMPFGSSGVAKELLKQYRRRPRADK
jgi:predicted component of type VI protein secretion system